MFSTRVAASSVVGALALSLMVVAAPAGAQPAAVAAPAADPVPAVPKARQDYGGTPPLWVEHPYLKKVGKRAEIRAAVYVDPYRRPGADKKKHRNLKADQDVLRFKVAVGSKRFTNQKKSHAINPNLPSHVIAKASQKRKVSKRGVVQLKVRLSKKASRQVLKRSYKQRLASLAIHVEHWKDTHGAQKSTANWALKQIHDAGLQKARPSKKERKVWLRSAKTQLRADRKLVTAVPTEQGQLAWAGDSPMYNYVYVTNSTPFSQQVQFNPNIQCMWTGSAQMNPPTQTATLPTGSLLQMVYILEPNAYTGDPIAGAAGGEAWSGLNGATDNMSPPNDAPSIAGDLITAGQKAGQALATSATQTSTYSEEGAIAAVGNAALTFVESFFASLIGSAGCNSVADYPETFAVTSTVVGFGTDNAGNAWSGDYGSFTPNTWMTTRPIAAPSSTTYDVNGPTNDPTFGPNDAGQNCDTAYNTGAGSCYWTGATQVGGEAAYTAMTECPAPTADTTPTGWCAFVYDTLQPMLGAQTSSTYYWNGGMPAPMVSNNAASGTFTGGAASFQGGLFQNVGPNPGLPGDAWCWGSGEAVTNCSYADEYTMSDGRLHNYNPMGAMNVQLTYLTTPSFNSGMVTSGAPSVSVSEDSSGDLTVTCDLSGMSAQLNTPFGPTNVSDTTLASPDTTTNGTQPVKDAQWLVSFYGLDADNNFVYYNPDPNVPVVPPATYYLAPEAAQQVVPFVTSGTPNPPVGTVLSANLGNMQTVADMQAGSGEIATLSQVGCSAVPMVNLQGLDISGSDQTVADNFGQAGQYGWPMPNQAGYGWPKNLFTTQYGNSTNYAWQTPVNAINVSFQGLPVVGTAPVPAS